MKAVAILFCVPILMALPEHSAHSQEQLPLDTGPKSADGVEPGENRGGLVFARPYVVNEIRTLFSLQDAAARGQRDAIPLQKLMLSRLAMDLSSDKFTEEANSLAAYVAGFVLSGGDPSIADHFSKADGTSSASRHLLKGTSLYMRGDRSAALKELTNIDPMALPNSIGGRVALASAMSEDADSVRSQHFLSLAISMMPGSLIEESSLRRSALLYAESRLQTEFWRRTEQYRRRFPHSLYAPDFLIEIVGQFVEFEDTPEMADRVAIDLLLNGITASRRRRLLIDLTRRAASRNQVMLTEFAAGRLRRISVPGGQEDQIALLYLSLFAIADARSDAAAETLGRLDPLVLPTQERHLLRAALIVADKIAKPAVIDANHPTPDNEESTRSELEERAETSLNNVAALLNAPVE